MGLCVGQCEHTIRNLVLLYLFTCKVIVLVYYYRPQRSCGQGNVFTAVCDSVHRGGLWQGEPPTGRENPPPPSKETTPAGRTPPPPSKETPLAGRPPPAGRAPPWQGEPPSPWQVDPPPAYGQ